MLLLLDGLDEVKEDRRERCVEAINQFRAEHGLTSLVVCSRIEEYAAAAIKTKLSFEGAVALQPLTSEQVEAYIDRFGESLFGVRVLLRKDQSLRELAETPLMLSIMSLAYKDKKADDLLGLDTVEKQRRHLFDTYIERMFERSARSVNLPFTKVDILHYLSWLARTMRRQDLTTYQIEAMQPSWLEKRSDVRLYKLFAGLIFGLIFGLIGWLLFRLVAGQVIGLIAGLPFGLVVGLIVRRTNRISMVDRLGFSWAGARRGLRVGLVFGLVFGLGWSLLIFLRVGLPFELASVRDVWLPAGLALGVLFGLLFGLSFGLSFGLASQEVEKTTYPGQRLRQTLHNGLFFGLLFGLPFGLIGWMSLRLGGLLFGLGVGLVYGYRSLIQHYVLRGLLTRRQVLPRHLIPFLEYCVSLIFLQRVGGTYVFVHRLLMEHFADMGTQKGAIPRDLGQSGAEEQDASRIPAGGEPPL